MQTLTKAEEQVMQILWRLEEATVSEMLKHFEMPKPAYNTVSTIVRILEQKEFVTHRKQGKGHIYLPLVSKSAYTRSTLNQLINGYFDGSPKALVSFFVRKNNMSLQELNEIIEQLKD
ncbi:MAG: BlaI/MecI/CopY family transcriptional regulator [Flavobacteriaceae bacterium]|nr:BlaI/MecI/CopY family transcriptional regulator [Flavobacteriaceae bacterium]